VDSADLRWHRTCVICFEPFEQERHRGRPQEVCGSKLCIAIQRYRQVYGRWPPRVWFERYAVSRGLIKVKLPKKARKLMERCAA